MLQPSFLSTLVLQCKIQDFFLNSSNFQHLAIMIPLHSSNMFYENPLSSIIWIQIHRTKVKLNPYVQKH